MKKRKQRRLTSTLTITTLQELQLLGVPVIYVLFDKEHLLGVMPMHIVDLQVLFSVAALLNLFFSLMPLAVFVLSLDESLEQGQNRSRMLTCIIPVVLL